jgi:hypothetical protein
MSASIVVPLEWDGIWSLEDSTYTCTGTPTGTSSSLDTLCTGAQLEPSTGSPIQFTCTGTADATSTHLTCIGSMDLFPDCKATYQIQMDGTRTGDTYLFVTTVNVTYSGTGTGCDLYPPSCTQINSHGTRLGPAPPAYCVTPARPSSWGKVKILYR